MDDEHLIAIMEAHMNASEESYFSARHQVDTGKSRHLFRAGFERGYMAALEQPRDVLTDQEEGK